ncbi:MAG: hypothetical protein WB975_02485, partial [Nitrososphaeraceae archaeon]
MSKTEQRSRPNLKFVISILIILVSFSLLCKEKDPLSLTHSALDKAQLGFTAKASSNYSLPLLLHSMSNNSILNTTSLAGSALFITKSMRNLNETMPEPGE